MTDTNKESPYDNDDKLAARSLCDTNKQLLKSVEFDFIKRLDRLIEKLGEERVDAGQDSLVIELLRDERKNLDGKIEAISGMQQTLELIVKALPLLNRDRPKREIEMSDDEMMRVIEGGPKVFEISKKEYAAATRFLSRHDIRDVKEKCADAWEPLLKAAARIKSYTGDKSFIPEIPRLLLDESIQTLTAQLKEHFNLTPPMEPRKRGR